MENTDLNQSLKTALEEFKQYLELQLKLNKAVFVKKAGEFTGQLFLSLTLGGIFGFALLFFTFSFANWWEVMYGSVAQGYLIAGGFYLVIGILVYLFRESLIFSKFRKDFGEALFNDESSITKQRIISKPEELDAYIRLTKEKTEKQEAVIRKKLVELGTVFNFQNLARKFISSAYHSMVTTSNIAKAVYLVTSHLKRKRRKKKKKLKA